LKYLLDSVIVIDHLNGIADATRFLRAHAHLSAVSVITRAEVLAGVSITEEQPVTRLLNQLRTLPMTVQVADRAAALRRSERWKLPDAVQAAIAIESGLVLVTRNTRDFQAGGTPEVLIPYEL
jgi:predicted nucleic acid-binding protein